MHYTATFRKRLSPQGRVLRHVVGHLPVPALDVPVPQMVDQLPDVVQFLAAQLLVVPEPVIEVPKILPHDIWSSRFFLWTAFNSVAFQETHF